MVIGEKAGVFQAPASSCWNIPALHGSGAVRTATESFKQLSYMPLPQLVLKPSGQTTNSFRYR